MPSRGGSPVPGSAGGHASGVPLPSESLRSGTSAPIHKYAHSLTDTEPPASEVSGSLKKCVRTYDLVYQYPVSVILTAGHAGGMPWPCAGSAAGMPHPGANASGVPL
ncbi:MAG: hypothetical protein B6245_22825 [Desulfobacteraceae bacterium 4572_88]|nr:MAG: hypothetical protein B6245_22825 [Desulfobacteraceae bacterium 4572_88]